MLKYAPHTFLDVQMQTVEESPVFSDLLQSEPQCVKDTGSPEETPKRREHTVKSVPDTFKDGWKILHRGIF